MTIQLPAYWLHVTPDLDNPIQIRIFDDGNEKYKRYDNCWIVFGKWNGKVALFNGFDENVIIDSISEWKMM